MARRALLVFDFSGTLSWASVLFGRSRQLTQCLRDTGLATCGLPSASAYFQVAVGPSWEACSTNPTPFSEALVSILQSSQCPADVLRARCDAFVARYVQASVVHPAWGPLLAALPGHPAVQAVVATDHYCDVTRQLTDQVRRWFRAEAHVLGHQQGACPEGSVLVANSALVGSRKSSALFWAAVKHNVPPGWQEPSEVFVVDDFGYNEAELCDYARSAVERREAVVAQLEQCFPAAKIIVFPFFVEKDVAEEAAELFVAQVEQTSNALQTLFANLNAAPSPTNTCKRHGGPPSCT